MRNISKNIILSVIGSIILAFGLYNIHSFSPVTEGGALGLTLLLKHWFDISPAVSGLAINVVCYTLGIKILGKRFLLYSMISAFSFSVIYKICEQYPPIWQEIVNYPLVAAVAGAIFVGVGVGLCVRAGGAPTGDDALALALSGAFNIKIETVYLICDLIVLVLSLTYIPILKIWYSLISVVLSGKIVGVVQRFGKNCKSKSSLCH